MIRKNILKLDSMPLIFMFPWKKMFTRVMLEFCLNHDKIVALRLSRYTSFFFRREVNWRGEGSSQRRKDSFPHVNFYQVANYFERKRIILVFHSPYGG